MLRLLTSQQPPPKKLKCCGDEDPHVRETPPDLLFSFDLSSDEEETETNHSLRQSAERTTIPARSILKTDCTTTTETNNDPSFKCKRVRWRKDKLVTHAIGSTGRSMNQLNEHLSRSDVWFTRDDLDEIKRQEMSLYYRHTSSVNADQNPSFPTAKMYLLECKGVYDWMETELFSQPTASTDKGNDVRKRKRPLQQQEDWTNEDFFRLLLHNSPALWNGWTYFRGMESARTRWRKVRNKATVLTILQLQRHKKATELAVEASRLTAVDAIWAHFAAVGDEQQLLMDELDALQHEFDLVDSSETL